MSRLTLIQSRCKFFEAARFRRQAAGLVARQKYYSCGGSSLADAAHLLGNAAYLLGDAAYFLDDAVYFLGDAAYLSGDAAYLFGGAVYLDGDAAYLLGNAAYLLGAPPCPPCPHTTHLHDRSIKCSGSYGSCSGTAMRA